jgi:uncharacterized repeat protein (TIGR03803 family)
MAKLFCAAIFATTIWAQAQTFTVLHNFTGGLDGANPSTGGLDGANPSTGLTIDGAGNLYGTAQYGGFEGNDCYLTSGCGTIFKLTPSGTGWIFRPLYQFQGFPSGDGTQPESRVIIGVDGSLYGTTNQGGGTGQNCGVGCGIVFKLTPPPTFCRSFQCSWHETILYSFTGTPDGVGPSGELAFDGAGNLYGTTRSGGTGGYFGGIVYELTPAQGSWSETILYNFPEGVPFGGAVRDQAGNLYGTTSYGGEYNDGVAYQLALSGSEWTLNTLHAFGGPFDGYGSYGMILDHAGNLYGGTYNGMHNGEPVAYELSPSGGNWTYNILHVFPPLYGGGPGGAELVMDAAGNLYGTTAGDYESGNPYGNVFKLTLSDGAWVYSDLYDFTGGSDGGRPFSSVVIDASGNLYGTTSEGGSGSCKGGCGVVWEITP